MGILKDIWSVVLLGLVFATGLIASRLFVYKLGLRIPRLPQQADESTAVYYLLAGSLLLAWGFFILVKGIGGSTKVKFLITLFFLLLSFAIGITIESAIYSTIESYNLTIILLVFPAVLFALVASMITSKKQVQDSSTVNIMAYFAQRPFGVWIRKIMLAIVVFPVIYFLFGIIASPFVVAYYETIEGLNIPDTGTIISIQLIRSVLFLVSTIPIIIYWEKSKASLVISLGVSFFVMVFAYDMYLAIAMPIELVLIHGIEIAADSFIYSWLLVKLLSPKKGLDS
jgi:hypothetical protein